MTKEQAKELYDANAQELMLKFTSYWKYDFNFSGENDAIAVGVTLGGNSDDIYRHDVSCEPFKAPASFDELMRDYYQVTITDKATGEKFNDYHY